MAFFKKVACFTDIHFGMKGNSRVHNDDCEQFVKWFIETAKAEGCETCIFLGDWHHHRSSTNVSTMNYTVSNMERLGEAFEKVYVIMGNHDLFYREKREINSMEFIRNIPNVHIVNEWLVEDDVAIIPWIVGDEYKKIQKMKQQYVFGHFELPYFKMNAMVEMPDVGGIQTDHFAGCGQDSGVNLQYTSDMLWFTDDSKPDTSQQNRGFHTAVSNYYRKVNQVITNQSSTGCDCPLPETCIRTFCSSGWSRTQNWGSETYTTNWCQTLDRINVNYSEEYVGSCPGKNLVFYTNNNELLCEGVPL